MMSRSSVSINSPVVWKHSSSWLPKTNNFQIGNLMPNVQPFSFTNDWLITLWEKASFNISAF